MRRSIRIQAADAVAEDRMLPEPASNIVRLFKAHLLFTNGFE